MKLKDTLLKSFSSLFNSEPKSMVQNDGKLYATVKSIDGDNAMIVIDGNAFETAALAEIDIKVNDRVAIDIKDHTCYITSNVTAPASAYTASDTESRTKAYVDSEIIHGIGSSKIWDIVTYYIATSSMTPPPKPKSTWELNGWSDKLPAYDVNKPYYWSIEWFDQLEGQGFFGEVIQTNIPSLITGLVSAEEIYAKNLTAGKVKAGGLEVDGLNWGLKVYENERKIILGQTVDEPDRDYRDPQLKITDGRTWLEGGEFVIYAYGYTSQANNPYQGIWLGGRAIDTEAETGEAGIRYEGPMSDVYIPSCRITSGSGTSVVVNSKTGQLYKTSSSSRRYKHDIRTLDSADWLYDIPVVLFKYNEGYLLDGDEAEGKDIPGFIAEDIEKYSPISNVHDGDEPEMWKVEVIVPQMLKLIQDQHKKIEELEARIIKMEGDK